MIMTNKQIANRIRLIGNKNGLVNDTQITKKAGYYADTIKNIEQVKTSPRLDTLSKFADALGVGIEDLIYDRTDADIELSKILRNLSEYEKTELVVYARMLLREKNENSEQKRAA